MMLRLNFFNYDRFVLDINIFVISAALNTCGYTTEPKSHKAIYSDIGLQAHRLPIITPAIFGDIHRIKHSVIWTDMVEH